MGDQNYQNLRRRRRAERGRFCVSCSIYDDEVSWSNVLRFCEPCERAAYRNGTCKCGRVRRRPQGRGHGAALCVTCDTKVWLMLGFSPTFLVCPTDDRERIIWRVTTRKNKHPERTLGGNGPFPEVMIATPEQWRTRR